MALLQNDPLVHIALTAMIAAILAVGLHQGREVTTPSYGNRRESYGGYLILGNRPLTTVESISLSTVVKGWFRG
ncbi:hypothetical protein FB390_0143 [Nocardia bhagyanarayanae]|uniref:Uncharacterized protein n=1 Tax=Nocardia bhagyanarayanae TaxID=1215925 RepID=A0A543F465_9NOCA|nr:hypothetical protein FB390_0143 [Nocardia bhagyanarayanae]